MTFSIKPSSPAENAAYEQAARQHRMALAALSPAERIRIAIELGEATQALKVAGERARQRAAERPSGLGRDPGAAD